MSAEGEAASEPPKLPFWAKSIHKKFTTVDGPIMYMLSTVVSYGMQVVNGVLGVTYVQGNDTTAAALIFSSIVLPPVAAAWMLWGRYQLSDSTKPHAQKYSLMLLFNMFRGWSAWRYLKHGTEPRWDDICFQNWIRVAVGLCPTLGVNLGKVAFGTIPEGLSTYLVIISSLSSLLGLVWATALFHYSKGPPGNHDKYRLFDPNGPRASRQLLLVFTADITGIWYRVGIIAVMYAATGLAETAAYLFFSYLFQCIMQWESMSQLPLPLMQNIGLTTGAALTFLICEPVFEPIAANDMFCRHALPWRLLQGAIGFSLIARSYETMEDLPGSIWVWVASAFTLVNFFVWTGIMAFCIYREFSEIREEKRLQAQAFFNMLAEMKRKKKAEAEAKKAEAEGKTEAS